MYYCTKFGVREHLKVAGKRDGMETEAEREAETAAEEYAFLQSLRGRIGYVLQMEPENREFLEYLEEWKRLWEELENRERK